MSSALEKGLEALWLRSKVSRWLLSIALVLVGVLGSELRGLVFDELSDAELLQSQVVEIVDGDTIVVEYHGPAIEREIVRLLNIDTPERGEALFEAATEAMAQLVSGCRVRLEFEEPGAPARGAYGRLLCYVFVDERNVNVELVRQGWSKYWTKYGRSRFEEEFQEAEAEARREGRGIWAAPDNAPP